MCRWLSTRELTRPSALTEMLRGEFCFFFCFFLLFLFAFEYCWPGTGFSIEFRRRRVIPFSRRVSASAPLVGGQSVCAQRGGGRRGGGKGGNDKVGKHRGGGVGQAVIYPQLSALGIFISSVGATATRHATTAWVNINMFRFFFFFASRCPSRRDRPANERARNGNERRKRFRHHSAHVRTSQYGEVRPTPLSAEKIGTPQQPGLTNQNIRRAKREKKGKRVDAKRIAANTIRRKRIKKRRTLRRQEWGSPFLIKKKKTQRQANKSGRLIKRKLDSVLSKHRNWNGNRVRLLKKAQRQKHQKTSPALHGKAHKLIFFGRSFFFF